MTNCAAVTGSPRTAGPTELAVSERKYLWKFGSSYNIVEHDESDHRELCRSTARIKDHPETSVGVDPGAAAVLVGAAPPVDAPVPAAEVVVGAGEAPGRHWL